MEEKLETISNWEFAIRYHWLPELKEHLRDIFEAWIDICITGLGIQLFVLLEIWLYRLLSNFVIREVFILNTSPFFTFQ